MRLLKLSASALILGVGMTGTSWANPSKREGNAFVYSDGLRVRAIDPQGREGTADANGTISYADGTRVAHDTTTGDTRITRADGRVETNNSHSPTRTGDSLTYADGTQVRAADPSGRIGTVGKGGSSPTPMARRSSMTTSRATPPS